MDVLYIQLANCWLEKKNRYFCAYVENLVRKRLLKPTEVSFFSVGHTHTEIEQTFRLHPEAYNSGTI